LSPALAAALLTQAAQPLEAPAGGRLLDVAAALDRQVYTAGTAGTAYGRPGPPAQGPGADPLR